jgi:hypothetical protein
MFPLRPLCRMSFRLSQIGRCASILVAGLMLPLSASAEVALTLKTNAVNNTYVNGQEVVIELLHGSIADGAINYYWINHHGKRLSTNSPLDASGESTIRFSTNDLTGYLGLVLVPVDDGVQLQGREPGESREFGFAVFPEAAPVERRANPREWMGVVHADIEDPWLGGWLKTMTWKTTSAKWWSMEMEKRRDAGFTELPIISGSEWKWDDEQKIKPAQLSRLKRRARDYIAADPDTLYWETGIEENLGGGFNKPFYFANLAEKSTIVRSVADKANPDIKLVFQIANMRYKDVGVFMRSEASKNYDIIALHPYNWADFPPPEEWVNGFLDDVRDQMKAAGRVLPLWVTEVGAPHQGNSPGAFFGYPKKKKVVRGLSNLESANYLIKFHVMSYQYGVEKVFWYNYRDRGPNRDYAEDHFGLIDFWGFPKPAYVAYVNLFQSVADKSVEQSIRKDDILAYRFMGAGEDVIVAWLYPSAAKEVSLADLGVVSSKEVVIKITGAFGEPIEANVQKVELSAEPVFIFLNDKAAN